MSKKHVKSTDPRKKIAVAHLKTRSGGNKVTLVQEDATHFYGKCLKYNGSKYDDLGTFSVPKQECVKKPLDAAMDRIAEKMKRGVINE